MSQYHNHIMQELIESNLVNYWPDFKMVAFALFDDKHVYLYNHPKFNHVYQILNRDAQFYGCTLILYEEYPTAIVDLNLYDDYASVFSLLVHELFHGYQYLKGENRFPNEMLGITYPLTKENVQLRNEERVQLYHALLETEKEIRQEYINRFVTIRNKRSEMFGEHFLYEELIETTEGPAWYVELRAFAEKSNLEYASILQKYGQSLLDVYESTANIRRGCYSSGLFMCMLLDELSPKWKDRFLGEKGTLYDLFKQHSDREVCIEPVEVSEETEKVIQYVLEKRQNEFEKFQEQEGQHVIINGKITATAFDPMNIISIEKRQLHKSFIKVRINNEEYLIQQPVIVQSEGGFQNILKLHLVLIDKPIENGASITINGIGEIKGMIRNKSSCMEIYL